jgi:hypothetical protein
MLITSPARSLPTIPEALAFAIIWGKPDKIVTPPTTSSTATSAAVTTARAIEPGAPLALSLPLLKGMMSISLSLCEHFLNCRCHSVEDLPGCLLYQAQVNGVVVV